MDLGQKGGILRIRLGKMGLHYFVNWLKCNGSCTSFRGVPALPIAQQQVVVQGGPFRFAFRS